MYDILELLITNNKHFRIQINKYKNLQFIYMSSKRLELSLLVKTKYRHTRFYICSTNYEIHSFHDEHIKHSSYYKYKRLYYNIELDYIFTRLFGSVDRARSLMLKQLIEEL